MENEAFHDLVESVALDLGWKADGARMDTDRYYRTYREIVDGEGRAIAISRDDYRKKLNISGRVPSRDELDREISFWGHERPSIKVSQGRAASAVASEIKRRLLPDYETYFQAWTKRKADHDAYYASKEGLARAMADAGVATFEPDRYGRKEELRARLVLPTGVYGDAQLSEDTVTLTLRSLSGAQAIAALRAIQGAK